MLWLQLTFFWYTEINYIFIKYQSGYFMFILLLVSVITLQASIPEYQRLQINIDAVAIKPITVLARLEKELTTSVHFLSVEERENLVKQLEDLKTELCARPAAGLLVLLPLLATTFFGVKSLFYYHDARIIAQNWYLRRLDSGNAVNVFMHNFVHFTICLLATVALEIEYRESVAGLFGKERTIERKINQMIGVLKNV